MIWPAKRRPGRDLELQRRIEQGGRIDVGVAVQPAEPRELGILEAGDGAEDAHLLGMLQLGLEADHVVERAQRIVLAKLDHRIGLGRRIVGIGQAHRLHRAVPQRLGAALRHDFDRQAAVEIGRALPFLELGLAALD